MLQLLFLAVVVVVVLCQLL